MSKCTFNIHNLLFVCASFLGLVFILYFISSKHEQMQYSNHLNPLSSSSPRLFLTLGQRIDQVQAKSTYVFNQAWIESMKDAGRYIIEDPVTLVYDDPKVGFELPEARFLWISTATARIFEVKVSPHLEALNLRESHQLYLQTIKTISEANWSTKQVNSLSLAELETVFRSAWNEMHTFQGGSWTNENVVLSLSIRRMVHNKAEPQEDRFVLTIRVYDSKLHDRFMSLVEEQRVAHGNPKIPLPLHFWLGASDEK